MTGFLSDEEALAGTKAIEAQLGADISPAYLSLKRARVEAYTRGDSWNTGVGIPEHMAVEVGDLVELNSRHRAQQARRMRTQQHGFAIICELGRIEVSVGIDVHVATC